jgi:hypothetical protein
MLGVGLTSESLKALATIQASPSTLYWSDYESHLTGFARVIQFTTTDKKIVAFREGEFSRGKQTGFGRMVDTVLKANMISYTGWWPTTANAKGISVIGSSFTTFQGKFNKNADFPSSGLDSLKEQKTITSLTTI